MRQLEVSGFAGMGSNSSLELDLSHEFLPYL